LGGVKDEAEIRGHRRTYVGSMPGLIIQAIKRTGVNNPVILLDEIDKLGRDHRGDPASALLEVLDPEQNSTFSDHYLNLSFDLSKVLFIATANEYETIPPPLLDRMVLIVLIKEVIKLSGYTINEKLEIARRFLLPKQTLAHGLPPNSVTMTDKVLEQLIVGYTREAGVRTLEREIAALCRKIAVEFADLKVGEAETFTTDVTMERLEQILGTEIFENEVAQRQGIPGVVTGLAYSSSGSGGLLFIEASSCPGKGQLVLTGKLGDVIKESAKISLSWVKTNFHRLLIGISIDFFEKNDIHIHFPAGATPKDGPSAGIAITVGLVSMLQNKAISSFTAMTGEITLHGQVLPVGGIKEKLLAAHRAGIKRVLIPKRNRKDLQDIPAKVQQEMDIQLVSDMWSVLDFCSLNTLQREILARL
jgi:ATP-dependent Lon protease